MSAIASFLRALVVDPRSRRAMEETIADARDERPGHGGIGRAWWALRSAAAVSRVLLAAGFLETRQFGGLALAMRLVITLAIPAAVYVAAYYSLSRASGADMTGGALFLLLIPQALAAWFPFGAWWLSVWPRRDRWISTPFLVTCLAIGQFLLVGWIVPETNQWYRTTVFDAYCDQQPRTCQGATLSRGVAELPLPQLVRRWPDAPLSERRQVEMRLLLCGLVAGAVALGGAVNRSSRRFRLALTPVVILAVVAALHRPNAISWLIVGLLVAAAVGLVSLQARRLSRANAVTS